MKEPCFVFVDEITIDLECNTSFMTIKINVDDVCVRVHSIGISVRDAERIERAMHRARQAAKLLVIDEVYPSSCKAIKTKEE